MSVVRMNISIPEELARKMNELTGPRKKSNFIAEALKHWIEETQREKIQQDLEEGYKARKKESTEMAKEFENADLEGWDEY